MNAEQVDRYLGRRLVLFAPRSIGSLDVIVGAIDPTLGLVTLRVITPGYSSQAQQVPVSYFLEALAEGVLQEAA